MTLQHWSIREMKPEETGLLENFLYEAIFQEPGSEPLPRAVIQKPDLKAYIDGFGSKDDHCLVACADGAIVGAVWARIIAGPVKGYGNIDEYTPELAISVREPYRAKGIGTGLMKAMFLHLRNAGYPRASLSVDKKNYAYRMYEALGFRTLQDNGHDCLMVRELW